MTLEKRLQKMEPVKINNSKGRKIAAVIHRPKKRTEKLAILCPGNLDSKDYTHLIKLAEVLAERGYTAVRFDPTGTWESEGETSEYTVTQYLADIRCVLEHMLKEAPYSDILVGGHSRGGQVSILYASRDPRVTSVIGIMPPSRPSEGNQREKWEKTGIRISERDLPFNKNEKREFRLPFLHVLDRDKYDVVGDVKKTKAKVVLIAGELDEAVPSMDVKEIFDKANEPKTFILIKNIGHSYRHNLAEIEIVNNEILKALGI
ncbi:MAG TPA: alpha/beta hydrolase [Candidatus Paceibacterota bacterium]